MDVGVGEVVEEALGRPSVGSDVVQRQHERPGILGHPERGCPQWDLPAEVERLEQGGPHRVGQPAAGQIPHHDRHRFRGLCLDGQAPPTESEYAAQHRVPLRQGSHRGGEVSHGYRPVDSGHETLVVRGPAGGDAVEQPELALLLRGDR